MNSTGLMLLGAGSPQGLETTLVKLRRTANRVLDIAGVSRWNLHVKQNPPNSARKGAFVAVTPTRGKQLFVGSILTVKYFYEAIGVRYIDELLVRSVDKRGVITRHPTALSDAHELGRMLVQK